MHTLDAPLLLLKGEKGLKIVYVTERVFISLYPNGLIIRAIATTTGFISQHE